MTRPDRATEIAELLNRLTTLMADQPAAVVPEPVGNTVDSARPALISVLEAAKLLGLTRASAYRYAAAGQLPVKRFGRRVYVVRALLADCTMPDPTADPEADAA